MPDIDSINRSFPPSHAYSNGTHSPSRHSPSRHASSSSLAAAATINAGFQNEEPRRSSTSSNRGRPLPQASRTERERRRSNAFLSSHDPTLPGPGELQVGELRGPSYQGLNLPFRSVSPQAIGSPVMGGQRDRAPSLGELHQELEAEQEAQVVSGFSITVPWDPYTLLTKAFTHTEPFARNDSPSASAAASDPATSIIHTSQQLHGTR